MTETTTKIRCGNHSGTPTYHASVAEVRACYTGRNGVEPPATSVYEQASAARAAETHAWIHEGEKPTGPRTSDVPAAVRRSVLDRMAASLGGNTTERRAAYRAAWASDETEATPEPAPVRTAPRGDATEKQISYLRSLLRDRVVQTHLRGYASEIETGIENGDLMKREASLAISTMKEWHRVPKSYTIDASGQGVADPRGTIADEDGIYRDPKTGRIFKVQWNRASGDGRALYAKRLLVDGSDVIPLTGSPDAGREVSMDWVYAGGLAKAGVEKAWRMNREDAAKFGKLYGVCVRCHRDLTDEQSIDRAMGPICAGKMGW